MANQGDSLSLQWVRGEIQETLRQSQKALEAFAENREDLSQLRFCLNHLHQVHGTLRMVELDGGALVAAEMEALAEKLFNDPPEDMDKAISSLMQGILQLPEYLAGLSDRDDDIPMQLLPLFNDLRAARNAAFFSASALFRPDLNPARFDAPGKVNQRLQAQGVLDNVRKLHQMFRFALSGLDRGVDIDAHLDYLDKVLVRLIKLCQKTPQGELWLAAGAFVDTLRSGHTGLGAATTTILRELDEQLTRLVDESQTILAEPVREDALKNLLYYIALGSECDSERVQTLVKRYQLHRALPSSGGEPDRGGTSARAAMRSVVEVLIEELTFIKDRLDLFVRAGERSNSDLEELLPGLQQIANTLSILGQDSSRQVIEDQWSLVERLINTDEPVDDGTLMDMAGALLYVEASITGLADRDGSDMEPAKEPGPGGHSITHQQASEAGGAVLREARNALEQVKTGVVSFIASQWDQEEIKGVPELLFSIRGSLQLIPLERTATVVGACERYIQDVLLDEAYVPAWGELDTLADAITSIEYHIERLMDNIHDNNSILAMAEQRLENLGFPPGQEPTWKRPEAQSASQAETPEPVTSKSKARDADIVDEDILEIFVEEADEVLETVRDQYPKFRNNHEDREALTDVRRAFHTLKGSGRLVGATSIGELGWAVENLLNRILDRSISPNDSAVVLLDRVINRLPGLIREFREGQVGGDVAELMEQAHRLADARQAQAPPAEAESDEPVLHETVDDDSGMNAQTDGEAQETDDEDDIAIAEPADARQTAYPGQEEPVEEPLLDQEILDIFMEEAEEVLETIHEFLPQLLKQYDHANALTEVRRAFHTLKGSGRMVEALEIGELAWSVENALNRIIEGTIFMSDDMAALLQDVTEAIPSLVEDFRHQRSPSVHVSHLSKKADAIARAEVLDTELVPEPSHSPAQGDNDTAGETQWEHEHPSVIDPVLLDIFRSETNSHLDTLNQFLADAEGRESAPYTDNLARALHTLKGSAHTAGIDSIARITAPIEKFVKNARADGQEADRNVIDLLQRIRDFINQGLNLIESDPKATLEGTDTFLADLEALASERFPDDEELTAAGQTAQKPDVNLIQIFLDEGIEQLLDADRTLEDWLSGSLDVEGIRPLAEGLSCLALSADRAGVHHVSELAGALEHLYAEAMESRETPRESMSNLLREAHETLINLMDELAAGLATESTATLVTRLNEQTADLRQARSEAQDMAFREQFGDDLESMDQSLSENLPEQSEPEPAGQVEAQQADIDPELAEIFLEEAHELVDSSAEALHQYLSTPADTNLAKTLQRDLHTLKGGARMAEIAPIADLSHELEDLFERVAEGRLELEGSTGELLMQCHDALARMVEQISELRPCEDASGLTRRVHSLISGEATEEPAEATETPDESPTPAEEETGHEAIPQATADADGTPDTELSTLFLDEARKIEGAVQQILNEWQDDPDEGEALSRMREELHTLKGGAQLSELDAIGELAEAWESTLASVIEGAGDSSKALNYSQQALQQLQVMLDMVEAGRIPALPDTQELEAESGGPAEADDPENVDPEVLEIFLEEAGELVDTLDNTLAAWQKADAEDAQHHNNEAQRALHTIKGGARLAELTRLGERAHHLESLLSRIEQGGNAPTEQEWKEIHRLHDEIIGRVEQVQKTYRASLEAEGGRVAPASQAAPEDVDTATEPEAETHAQSESQAPANTTVETETRADASDKDKQQGREQRKAELARSAQETIRINAQLMDELVNLAGETSITRGRMEQQISDFSQTLDEMAATTERLREQLRRMEIETEAQILYRAEQEFGPDYEQEFDPLEMDRYSSIQQLSRALSESASDLTDLRETMADKVRDAETLLLQQQRTNTELQEGLMKTRMVPFSSMVPRLRRIVRQISGETGKKAHFEVNNAEGELDRTVLDRMVAPLEHMLRNAIDHGIEDEQGRADAGKPGTGHITLNLSREGGEVVLKLEDDGGGINTSKIRDRAIRQGLLDSGERLGEHEILQFILQPGFSTAASVTQISGRGVGMDVVASEIKQLGGSLEIDSSLGRGTTFTVRLPFTVSVNRALMVTIGEDHYAIPLNTIEGIVRVSTYELEEYYQQDAPPYEYAGQQYRLQYLGALLNSEHQPKLHGQALPLPVMLVRGADQPMALQVDSLMGSREIVVKSLGPQFAGVRGVSGATILGDGNVVIILDLPAMIRGDILAQRQRMLAEVETREASREHRPTQVMVVDDSVTVRKVTSRLLERHGMDVLLAKDGLDAVGQLQDRRPDVVLLDIEMPRMDGFEVANFIRHDSKLRDVPIIMITSRTGDKHRERAEAIGVNHYLGKPFQEKELLDTIMEQAGVGETT